jgi:AraC-like DNA-binding protein
MVFDDLELDLPPEYCHYQDNGCEFADSCLDCPFPDCLYDQPGGKQRWLKNLRDEAVLRLFNDQAKTVKELAGMFGVSRRTIQRILKQAREIPARKSRL